MGGGGSQTTEHVEDLRSCHWFGVYSVKQPQEMAEGRS